MRLCEGLLLLQIQNEARDIQPEFVRQKSFPVVRGQYLHQDREFTARLNMESSEGDKGGPLSRLGGHLLC